jgi:hypothetical protein
VSSSMRLGVPFIAPSQLGAVENKSGGPSLPSVVGRTGQSGAHRTLSSALISFLKQRSRPLPTVADLAHRTVRCTPDSPVPHSDRWHGHVSGADRAADRWLGRPLAHRTVRCTPDSLVNYSRTPSANSRERPFRPRQPGAPDTVRCATGQSGAPDRNSLLAVHSQLSSSLFFLFLTLRKVY